MNSSEKAQHPSKPKRYLWIIMILPIGLIIGTVTSTYNHLKSDQEEDKGLENWVSQDFNAKSLKADIDIAFDYPTDDVDQQLRRVSSALGLDSYLSTRMLKNRQGKVGYLDIDGKDKEKILAVVVELDQADKGAQSTQIGLSVAVIKSLLGERGFAQTLRFIYVPETKSALELEKDVIERGETYSTIYVLRPFQGERDLEGKVKWKAEPAPDLKNVYFLSHPALNTGKDEMSEQHIDLTLDASKSLRELLLDRVNPSDK